MPEYVSFPVGYEDGIPNIVTITATKWPLTVKELGMVSLYVELRKEVAPPSRAKMPVGDGAVRRLP